MFLQVKYCFIIKVDLHLIVISCSRAWLLYQISLENSFCSILCVGVFQKKNIKHRTNYWFHHTSVIKLKP